MSTVGAEDERYATMSLAALLKELDNKRPGSVEYERIRGIMVGRAANELGGHIAHGAEATAKGAKLVTESVEKLVASLTTASEELRTASKSSAAATEQLNTYTRLLAIATIVLAVTTAVMTGGAIYQAFQSKRQADLLEKQMKHGPSPFMPGASREKALGNQAPK